MTAVFIGSTKGIGLATIKAFAKQIAHPKAIIVGRNRTQFAPEIDGLRALNSNGEYIFIEHEIALIKDIDDVCDLIKQQVNQIKFLIVSQGYIGFGGRENNADGLDDSMSLRYYGRIRFTQNLLPIMAPGATAVSVLAGGMEGYIFEDDLDLERNYTIPNTMGHFASLHTLAYDKLAEQHPDKGFVHYSPGFVSTGLLGRSAQSAPWWLKFLISWVLEPLCDVFSTSPEESGERVLYHATNELYGSGSWPLHWKGEKVEGKALVEYRERRFQDRVEGHNFRMFERAVEGGKASG